MLRLSRRLAAGGAMAALALFAYPSAAQAADVSAKIFMPNVTVAPGASAVQSALILGDGTPHNVTVTIDTSSLPAHVTMSDVNNAESCDTSGTTVTCTLGDGDLNNGAAMGVDVTLSATSGATVGDTGKLKVTVDSDDTSPFTSTATVTVAEGVDLTAGPNVDVSTSPGKHVSAALTVANTSKTTVHGAYLVMYGEDAFGFGTRYANCTYVGSTETYCEFDSDLAPGQSYALSRPYDLKIADDAQAPMVVGVDVSWMTPQDWADEKSRLNGIGVPQDGTHGSAAALTLVSDGTVKAAGTPAQTDTDPSDNHSEVTAQITGHNYADFEALGATVTATVGTPAEIKVGFVNHGPAAIRRTRSGNSTYIVQATFPAGVTVVKVLPTCAPIIDGETDWDQVGKAGYNSYGCASYDKVAVGARVLLPFTIRLDRALSNAKGSVTANQATDGPDVNTWDDNTANNTADIVINPPGGAGGSGDGSGDGSLPVTGSNTPLIAGVGALIVALGVLSLWFGRRRKRTA